MIIILLDQSGGASSLGINMPGTEDDYPAIYGSSAMIFEFIEKYLFSEYYNFVNYVEINFDEFLFVYDPRHEVLSNHDNYYMVGRGEGKDKYINISHKVGKLNILLHIRKAIAANDDQVAKHFGLDKHQIKVLYDNGMSSLLSKLYDLRGQDKRIAKLEGEVSHLKSIIGNAGDLLRKFGEVQDMLESAMPA